MTTQSGDILAWLETAISERETIARAAANLQDDPENGWGIVDDSSYAVPSKRRFISPHIGLTHEPEAAEHIVLNDPTSVLRRCAADRKLIGEHGPQFNRDWSCKGCGFDNQEEPVTGHYRDCPVLVGIAEGYGWTGGER